MIVKTSFVCNTGLKTNLHVKDFNLFNGFLFHFFTPILTFLYAKRLINERIRCGYRGN